MDKAPPLKIHVSGGRNSFERRELADAVHEALEEKGFKNIQPLHENYVLASRNQKTEKGKSIFDVIQEMSPSLFEQEVNIQADSDYGHEAVPLGRVKLQAGLGDDVEIIDTRGDVKQFLAAASDLGTTDEFTVSSTDPRAIAQAVQEILYESPNANVAAVRNRDPVEGRYLLSKF
jgi:hypothetical protein